MMCPLVIAHRGASAEFPEKTLPAFERAIEVGADFVELDVQARSGGELVVTNGRLRRHAGLPALAEVLDLCRRRIGVMVELKAPTATGATELSSER
jgi:glycerophosphoryl diester phosphodiesterase